MKTLEKAWNQAEVECATNLAQFYINSEGANTSSVAMDLVVSNWTKVMKLLNTSVQQQKFGDKTFDDLIVDEKLRLKFPPPHRTLEQFAKAVRFAAAVAQKVS